MKYALGSWSGLLQSPHGYTPQYVEKILADAANMWGEGTQEKQADGSYILTHEGVKNRIYFEEGQIWRSDEIGERDTV
jgi:hypothetical protein